jgi:hypothetical protein
MGLHGYQHILVEEVHDGPSRIPLVPRPVYCASRSTFQLG